MANLAPPLELLLYVRRSIENSESIKSGIINYLQNSSGSFVSEVACWLRLQEQEKINIVGVPSSTIYRQSLLSLLEQGLKGQSIYKQLINLEDEMVQACEQDLEKFVAQLPFKVLPALMLLQFPAFLMVLLGPLVKHFLNSLGA